ncbi:hypothetical protein [Paenibacillus sacheonensis]|uniref:DUF2269 family protein n=1 Tax=Paenibacillus sacheonensis TaxID=742054 RepID=A0A7X4YQZ2_9BACL|nr:hypothetical protein [Paenibacillus sacheonensis]MBM7567150.1 putative membrane protein [Paenibacillus sacheonensis]NBC70925.1 hypothetical protein [Paenibacillus sacheonensis]
MSKLTLQRRRILLLLHLIFASIMLGGQATFIILALTASMTDSAATLRTCYDVMHLLADTSVRASTIGTTVTGILLSVLTSWGLFRYYWLIAKEVLTLVTIAIGFVGLHAWTLRGVRLSEAPVMNAWAEPGFTVNHTWLWIGILLQSISLIVLFILSVWKPGGKVKAARSL